MALAGLDTVFCNILLQKLNFQHVGRCTLCWIKICLVDHSHQGGVVKGAASSWPQVTHAVPQGSVLLSIFIDKLNPQQVCR